MWVTSVCWLWAATLGGLPPAIQGLGAGPPPKVPPTEVVDRFTLNGTIPLEHYYVDDSNKGQGTHYKFSHDDIAGLIGQAQQFIEKVSSLPTPSAPAIITSSVTWLTQLSDIWLVKALEEYPIAGLHVAVFGSTSPRYEAMLLALGAHHITTVEYNRLTYDYPNITTLLLSNLDSTELQFDAAISLSSFDHDGLGRYGDPINPDGDLEAMKTVQSVLNEQGLLFLTVPVGADVVVWNLHRRYGNLRLPLLLDGWERVDCIGWDENLLNQQSYYTIAYEPVFILRKQKNIPQSQ